MTFVTRKGRIRSGAAAAIGATTLLLTGPSWADCFDATKHIRGGQWKEWILQLRPGQAALNGVQKIIDEINSARGAKQLAPLEFSKGSPIVFGVIDETNARGPSGERLGGQSSNQEIFFATFASIGAQQPVLLFIGDPFRSSREFTSAGVPGREAIVEVETKVARRDAGSAVSTTWTASTHAGDRVLFSARYTNSDIAANSGSPSAADYLSCDLFNFGTLIFRSLPYLAFSFLDRHEARVIADFGKPTVQVDLKLKLADPILDVIYNDPENRYIRLIEVDRVVRLERQL